VALLGGTKVKDSSVRFVALLVVAGVIVTWVLGLVALLGGTKVKDSSVRFVALLVVPEVIVT
jgi:hypothetical protein